MSGRLEAIWLKRGRGAPMDAVERAQLRAGRGLVGNANQGGKRQVTIIERRAWDRVVESVGTQVDPKTRRANLLVSGVELEKTRGRVLRIGGIRIRIDGETRPCNQMEEAVTGLQKALSPEWRGGVFGEVLDDGEIAIGQPVDWSEAMTTQAKPSTRIQAVTPILNVSNMADSLAWFEKLGWRKAWDWGDPPDFGSVESGDAEIFLCLDGHGGRGQHGAWMSWWVESPEAVDAVYRLAVERGIEVTQEPMDRPWNLREFSVRHPDGHQFRIGGSFPETDGE